MRMTSEIYLTKEFVSKEEWLAFTRILSDYNGIFRKWKMIITNYQNEIRYYVETRCSLPSTMNSLNSFLLKPTEGIETPISNSTSLVFPKIGKNIIDLINYSEIRKKGNLIYLEIKFQKICENRIKSSLIFYLNCRGVIKKYKAIWINPVNILSVDFGGNKRYSYKKPPNYLEINKILHLLRSDASSGLFSVDTFPYLQGEFYFNQNCFSFDKHSIVIGSSGSGKSKFISLFINNIYKNENLRPKYKIVVIDPHASLEKDIGGMGSVIDFQDHSNSIDLFMNHGNDLASSTELLLDLLKSLIADQYHSKLERVLRHSLYLLLMDESFNFQNLRRLLLDLEYRNSLIKKLQNILPVSVIDFFLSDFNELKTKSYGEAISPIIGFIDEMEMIPVFHQDYSLDNLKTTIAMNFLTVFSLDRIKLGNKVTKTIAGLIMQQLLTIVQKQEIDKHIIFIIDEIAIVENPILPRYLSEARKFNLSLVLAGQYFNQISEELRSSIFANTVNYFIFRVSKSDAILLVDNFNMKLPLDDSKENKVKLLTELQNRECIARIDSNGILLPAFKGITLNYTSIPRIKIVDEISNKGKKNIPISENNFYVNQNVRLKDILISTSTSKKGV